MGAGLSHHPWQTPLVTDFQNRFEPDRCGDLAANGCGKIRETFVSART